MNTDIIWRPTPEQIARANVTRFMQRHGIADYATLQQRAVADIAWFWDAALDDLGFAWQKKYHTVVDGGWPFASWFLGGECNIAANCVDRHAVGARAPQPAVVWYGEDAAPRTLTFAALADQVGRCAAVLQSMQVQRGEAVGLVLPMCPEVVVALLACLKIGAIAVPIFSGYGADAIAVRLRDAAVRVVITADSTLRRGKATPFKATVDAACAAAGTIQHQLVVLRSGDRRQLGATGVAWDDALAAVPHGAETAVLPAEHHAVILYTSGTTGQPKGCVHTHAGALAQIAKEHGYHFDVKAGDRFFWLTDIGWMMGPWEILGALFHGAAVVLYEGAPDWPRPTRLWEVARDAGVTHLGISPTAVRVLKKGCAEIPAECRIPSLRIMGSTGEPWDDASYRWLAEQIGQHRAPIINISGGTEIIGCHLAPVPILPLKVSSLQGPALGMDVDVWNEAGESVRGEVGYLVCKQPAPSMTKGFLHSRERYLDTYFSKWSNIWNHGDWVFVDADGHWFMRGRADDTIKIAGKRVGPAEIESALMQHPSVAEAAAIGVPHDVKGETVVAFAVLKPDVLAGEILRATLCDHVARILGKPLRPETVRFVAMLPKTRSAKIVRAVIKKIYLAQELGDTSAVELPAALAAIRDAT